MKNLVMLEDFVSLVTETVPQLLTERQKSLLLVALRAKVNVSCLLHELQTSQNFPESCPISKLWSDFVVEFFSVKFL